MPERRTKIVATVGPATEARAKFLVLAKEGVNTVRLNFSHDPQNIQKKRIAMIRSVEREIGRPIAIMGDLQGPKMRVGVLPKEGVFLHNGDNIILDTSCNEYKDGIIPIPSQAFEKGVEQGSTIYLDDGSIVLTVCEVNSHRFVANVERGGTLYSRKGVNVPQLKLRSQIFEEKDKKDIVFARREKIDYLAISFVRSADDVRLARKLVGKSSIKLIAKIERPEALTHLEEIIDVSDGIMVARGDLGIETPLWQLPMRQKEIIQKAHERMKPVIVATQMLESMTHSSIPTRAEVNDVASAVYDSTDAVMLSAETASGAHPIDAVRMMRKILEATEQNTSPSFFEELDTFTSIDVSVAKSAKYIARQIKARMIVVGTASGYSAKAVSRYRPQTPILAITSDEHVARRLQIVWGVEPAVFRGIKNIANLSREAVTYLKKIKKVSKGDRIVFVSGSKLGEVGQTNNISVILVS